MFFSLFFFIFLFLKSVFLSYFSNFPRSTFVLLSSSLFLFLSLSYYSSVFSIPPDHGAQTVEARIWRIGREPEQHKCRHVYTKTLRAVSYHARRLYMTLDCYACTCGTVCIAPEWIKTPSQLQQIWFHNVGHCKTNIDLIQRKSVHFLIREDESLQQWDGWQITVSSKQY